MATVIIPDVNDDALNELRTQAEADGGSLEALVRQMIEERGRTSAAERRARAEEAIAAMRAYRERIHADQGPMPDSTEWLRQDRAAW